MRQLGLALANKRLQWMDGTYKRTEHAMFYGTAFTFFINLKMQVYVLYILHVSVCESVQMYLKVTFCKICNCNCFAWPWHGKAKVVGRQTGRQAVRHSCCNICYVWVVVSYFINMIQRLYDTVTLFFASFFSFL